ncbi:GIY-YIG nuclease family protein [Brevundimonas sp.]|uniref:GIY-YIG nuclease family protein n=1 Tax=Brevundimonas sp. TaxID=1871086 RepID=UPI00391A9313
MVTKGGLIGVYIMTGGMHGTLYVGVTSDLIRRIWEHRTGQGDGFTKRYGLTRLVWYEVHDRMIEAIAREKRLKRWNRDWKTALIERTNPDWSDLYDSLVTGGVAMPPDPDTYRDWMPRPPEPPRPRPLPKGWRTDET